MKLLQKRFILSIFIISLLFFAFIAIDISPMLRGPGVYPPDWRWDYLFINTVSRVWAPISLIFILLLFINNIDGHIQVILKKEKIILIFLLIWSFSFILSVLFFSRSGITGLVERIIVPGANGQFTVSLNINNIFTFLSNFNAQVTTYQQHARSHPPGGILIFWFLNYIFQFFPKIDLINNLMPLGHDILKIWSGLLPNQKLTSIFSPLFITSLLTFPIIPIYYFGKKAFDAGIAFRSVVIYIATPSVILFVPLLDSFYNIFPLLSLLFLFKAIDKNKVKFAFISGLIMGIGLFFAFVIMPYWLIFFIVLMIKFFNRQKSIWLKNVFKFYLVTYLGTIITFLFLFIFFNFNLFQTFFSIHLVERSYFPWVFYNLYDFFIFAGIPVLLTYFLVLKDLKNKLLKFNLIRNNFLNIAFIITLFAVDILGVARGETGRIYLIFIPLLSLIVANYLSKELKLNTKFFIIFIVIQLIQVLVMQEFWVMLW